jgi:heavy metal sensor kinase
MNNRSSLTIRVRLTLWNVGAMILVLGVYVASVFVFVSRTESGGLDQILHDDYLWAAEMLDQDPDGTITWPTSNDTGSPDDGPWLQVWSPDGELLYRTLIARNNPLPETDLLAREANEEIVSVGAVNPPYRVFSVESRIGDEPVVIQVARSEFLMRRDLYQLLLVLLLGLPLAVAAAGLGGYTLARRALKPIERMANHAQLITAERLEDRLPIDNPKDELGRLASVFNDTLTRLESSFEQMRRFTAHVSHELRTPLTVIRSVGEVGLRGRRQESAYREIIGSMLEEVDRLAGLVDRLLNLSRAETGPAKLTVDAVDLLALAREVATQLEVLAEEKQQLISVESPGAPEWTGDRMVLRQALLNLVDNAIKFTPVGGRITVRVEESSSGVTIDVSDTGSGIPEALQAQVFERFYRVKKMSTSEREGTGLGLSIAKWAVEVNGGQLTLEESSSSGSTFRINLPRRQAKTSFVPSSRAG